MLVGAFRRSLGFHAMIKGLERKYMSFTRWRTPNAIVTMWTIEPVVSSTVIRGNSINVRHANETYASDLERIEPMSMTTHPTIVKAGNEIRGGWAGWIVWRAAAEMGNSDGINSVCLTCTMSSTLFGFGIQTTGARLANMAMTPETIMIVFNCSNSTVGSMGCRDVSYLARIHEVVHQQEQLAPSVRKRVDPVLRVADRYQETVRGGEDDCEEDDVPELGGFGRL
ncbi:hypothetical protein QQS21_011019 [Conoideocrella luteorostrata]|uniref:Uncharacterized protein n=1 Tax=Conoideocrella luteorostrata TaxID=1105319 RepID=A0AAJ0CE47_9HYPO|nr:hypothetical protein QQS21_011019 [Conoideocrella luteorostrata]